MTNNKKIKLMLISASMLLIITSFAYFVDRMHKNIEMSSGKLMISDLVIKPENNQMVYSPGEDANININFKNIGTLGALTRVTYVVTTVDDINLEEIATIFINEEQILVNKLLKHTKVYENILNPNDLFEETIKIKFNEDLDNNYQNKNIMIEIIIEAKQDLHNKNTNWETLATETIQLQNNAGEQKIVSKTN